MLSPTCQHSVATDHIDNDIHVLYPYVQQSQFESFGYKCLKSLYVYNSNDKSYVIFSKFAFSIVLET